MTNIQNRIDWEHLRLVREVQKESRANLIEELEDCALSLNDLYFGQNVDSRELLHAQELLEKVAKDLRGRQ